MTSQPPRSTRPETRLPYTTLFRSSSIEQVDNHSSALDTTNDRSVEPPPIVAEQGDLSPPETSSATDPLTSVSNKIRSDPGIAAAADDSFLQAFFGALNGGLLLNLMTSVFPILRTEVRRVGTTSVIPCNSRRSPV